MTDPRHQSRELSQTLAGFRYELIGVAIFSAAVNLLMLTGPLFMLQVYDRVLSSRSSATLVALFGLVLFLYTLMGFLDHVRGRVLARVGAGFQSALDRRVFDAVLRQAEDADQRSRPASGLRDLTSIQSLLASPALTALIDLPWAPAFLALLFIFHPMMGWFALAGGLVLFILAFANQRVSNAAQSEASQLSAQADGRTDYMRKSIETVQGLGMKEPLANGWSEVRRNALSSRIFAADKRGRLTAATKAFRLLLQSGILALGAWLVLRGELTPGAMIAGSILLGRALAPVEQSVAQWGVFQAAAQGWRSLRAVLTSTPPRPALMPLPAPESQMQVKGLAVAPGGVTKPLLMGVSFDIQPGEAVAVIGPSAAGKSTLAKALTGVWPPRAGEIRLGGADLHQYAPDRLGRLLGYLPQDVVLFPGTVAQNVARFDPDADPEDIVKAARAAGAHDLILGLPNGYDTVISDGGSRLSGGQRQRVGLARALFGNPAVLILDEPNSSLDDSGVRSLNQAIADAKEAGQAVLIISHRPSALAQCERVLLIDNGKMRAFGPRQEVLDKFVRKSPAVVPAQQGRRLEHAQ
ncbi:type I secretion system permease/ATPase [Aliiroseovarius sp. F47248L]|uniref:type I secretion system permease/ATPase n=1 Tax=Aliiroseovarius sp. F47248L TaxID=2926420 RepID=UPI001FF66E63|nr:type I secretion system permease/ATPase [Aliiroseovarius sp. F47248L]MCK0139339.1 type I secretion system permease/ATPase [Aliiroseovarius sp. F47248L]